MQLLVFLLCLTIAVCFAYEIGSIQPNWIDIAKGLIPKPSVSTVASSPVFLLLDYSSSMFVRFVQCNLRIGCYFSAIRQLEIL